MSRVFKYSKFPVELFVPNIQDAHTLEKVSVSLYTDDPSISADFVDGFTIEGDIIKMIVPDTALCNIKQGVIKYAVQGYKDGEFFIVERQSNYFLKNPSEFSGPDAVEIVITENGVYEGLYNKITVDVHNSDYRVGSLIADFEDLDGEGNYWHYPSDDNVDVYDYVNINATNYGNQKYEDGYRQGKAEGGSCNLEETRWVNPTPEEIDESGYLVYHPTDGYDGMQRVALQMDDYNAIKYNEGYNQGALDNGADGSTIGTASFSKSGTYVYPQSPVLQFNGTEYTFGYGNETDEYEIEFINNEEIDYWRPWYSVYLFGDDNVGIRVDGPELISANFFNKKGVYNIKYNQPVKIIMNNDYIQIDDVIYDWDERTDKEFDRDYELVFAKNRSQYGLINAKFKNHKGQETPLFNYKPSEEGLMVSTGGGEFNLHGELGDNTYSFVKGVNEIAISPELNVLEPIIKNFYVYISQEETWHSEIDEKYDSTGVITTKGMMYSDDMRGLLYIGDDILINPISIGFATRLQQPFVYDEHLSVGSSKVAPNKWLSGFDYCDNIELLDNVFEGAEQLKYMKLLDGLGRNLQPNQVLDFSPTQLSNDAFIDMSKTVYNFKVNGPNAKGVPTAYVKFNSNADDTAKNYWKAKGWMIVQ